MRVDWSPSRRIVELRPVELSRHASGSQLGTPSWPDARGAKKIITRIAELSAPLGTGVADADGIGIIECLHGAVDRQNGGARVSDPFRSLKQVLTCHRPRSFW